MSQLETIGYSTQKFNQTTFDDAELEAVVNGTLADDAESTGTAAKVSCRTQSRNNHESHPTGSFSEL